MLQAGSVSFRDLSTSIKINLHLTLDEYTTALIFYCHRCCFIYIHIYKEKN